MPCSVCRQSGHNIRTCPVKIVSMMEGVELEVEWELGIDAPSCMRGAAGTLYVAVTSDATVPRGCSSRGCRGLYLYEQRRKARGRRVQLLYQRAVVGNKKLGVLRKSRAWLPG